MVYFSHDRALRVLIDSLRSYASTSQNLSRGLKNPEMYSEEDLKTIKTEYALYSKSFSIYPPERADKLSIELLNYKVTPDRTEQLQAFVNREKYFVSMCLALYARKMKSKAKETRESSFDLRGKDQILKANYERLKIIEDITEHFKLNLPIV